MGKSLKDLTLEELWELFPIVLTTHRHEWSDWAKEEIQSLSALLTGFNPTISHIGSTAIPGIHAKPIVDLLVEVSQDYDRERIGSLLEDRGYICMASSETRMSFNKGYTIDGYADRVFHIHIRQPGDNDEITFRDYLIANPAMAKEYERLKLGLLPCYKHDRDGYTAAKSDFVNKVLKLAASRYKTH